MTIFKNVIAKIKMYVLLVCRQNHVVTLDVLVLNICEHVHAMSKKVAKNKNSVNYLLSINQLPNFDDYVEKFVDPTSSHFWDSFLNPLSSCADMPLRYEIDSFAVKKQVILCMLEYSESDWLSFIEDLRQELAKVNYANLDFEIDALYKEMSL